MWRNRGAALFGASLLSLCHMNLGTWDFSESLTMMGFLPWHTLPTLLYPGMQSHLATPAFTTHWVLGSHVNSLQRGSSEITNQR